MENAQFLERYRLLSRDIQNGLQTAQKQLSNLKVTTLHQDTQKIETTLTDLNESWLDFAGWILVSTLDNLEEAKQNCAPGLLDLNSKIIRSKMRRIRDLGRNAITVDIKSCQPHMIESYIPYFEQMLDLLFCNAIKYSPRGGTIDIATINKNNGITIKIDSVGPLLQKHEIQSLGSKGFRSEQALKTQTSGQGFGLYNVSRIAQLLSAQIVYEPEHRTLYTSEGIQMANFSVSVTLPHQLSK